MVVGPRGDMAVAELMEDFSVATPEGVALMSVLRVDEARAGCTCGGHASVKSLLGQALQSETDDTIIDMEAGIEHLGRAGGTLANADVLILMMEPSRKVVIPSTPDILAADRRGEPLGRAIAPDVWDAVEKLVDSLELEAAAI